MSLINDALRKARQEAAEQEAEKRGVSYQPPRAHLPTESKLGQGLLLGVLFGGLAAALGGAAVWWLLDRGPTPTVVADTKETTSIAEPVSSETPGTATSALSEVPGTHGTAGTEVPGTSVPAVSEVPGTHSEVSGTQETAGAQETTPSAPAAEQASVDDLPRFIEPPERIGEVAKNTYVLEAKIGDVELSLDFIVWSESDPLVQINGKLLAVGQLFDGWMVTEIQREQVTLRSREDLVTLRVR